MRGMLSPGEFYCPDCEQYLCKDCNYRVHKHPKRMNHNPNKVLGSRAQPDSFSLDTSQESTDADDEYNVDLSPSLEKSFHEVSLIATLAEKFNLTSFKAFQMDVINATIEGKDTLVIYPTGSGKSLCFQFPPVYLNKKAFIITPTISLMQDHVHKLSSKHIDVVFLGSAQIDRCAESRALDPTSKEAIVFVTPEWISKPVNQSRLQGLKNANKLALIAIDEAHLITEWSDFRPAFSELKQLKVNFPDTPIMALTATVTPEVEEGIKQILRDPMIKKTSVNRVNITLKVEELQNDKTVGSATQFALRATEIANSSPAIIYTDFIADIGPIVSALSDLGVEAVGYHGEMDAHSRQESYCKWKSGDVQMIVATKAFGMGIDKPDIRNVIQYGVPESILSWGQELGRAGRDGELACATILYSKTDVSHANAWVLNNLSNRDRCKQILSHFSDAWRYVLAHLAGICRRQLLLDLVGEKETEMIANGPCCDICIAKEESLIHYDDYKEELKILIDALDQVGCKGEIKVCEWIRGSQISWTNEYNKNAMSYDNHRSKDFNFWRSFMKQCHCVGAVKLEFKSLIKGKHHYSVQGVYYPLQLGRDMQTRQTKRHLSSLISNDISPRVLLSHHSVLEVKLFGSNS